MHNRYVLASHTPEQFAGIAARVADHQPGDGLRAALPVDDEHGEHTHLYALQGSDGGAVDGHHLALIGGPGVSLDPCDSLDCNRIEEFFRGVRPIELPPFRKYAFLLVDLDHDAVAGFVPPPTDAHVACLPMDGGRRLLIQVADDDEAVVADYVQAWQGHQDVRTTRRLSSSGEHLVRAHHR